MTTRQRILVAVTGTALACVLATAAYAAFTAPGTGGGTAQSATMPSVHDFTLAYDGGPNVAVSWAPVTIADTPFAVAGGKYRVTQYDSPTASTGREVCFTASSSCGDRLTTGGPKYYSVQTVLHNWTGQASAFKDVTVTLNGPSIAPVHPANGGQYQLGDWDALCGSASGAVCATVEPDTDTQITSTEVAVRNADGEYWTGSEFSATEEIFHAVDAADVRLALPSTALTVGDYVASFRATDDAGQTNTVNVPFSIVDAPVEKFVPTVTISSPTSVSQTETTVYYAGSTDGVEEYHGDITVRVYTGTDTSVDPLRTHTATRITLSSWAFNDTTPLEPGTYTIIATQDCDGCSADGVSPAVTLTIQAPAQTKPAAPSGLTATAASKTTINLTWSDNSNNETGFRLESSATGTNGWSTVATVTQNTTSTSDTSLTCDTQRFYRVIATNSLGDSTASNSANATTPACKAPSSPPVVTATPEPGGIELNWSAVVEATAYEVEHNVTTGPMSSRGWQQLGTTSSTTYLDVLACGGTSREYRVRATNQVGDGPNSTPVTGTTVQCPPAAPTLSTATSGNNINVSWTAVTGATGYRLEWLNGSTWQTPVTQTTTSYTHNLTCGASRTYRVFATSTGGDSAASSSVTGSTVSCPKATAVTLTTDKTPTAGKVNAGDTVAVSYLTAMAPTSFCGTWNGTTWTLANDDDVTVTVTDNGTNDVLTVSSANCSTLKFGSVSLGGNYVTATATFKGTGNNKSTFSLDPARTKITIELGAQVSGTANTSTVPAGTATYTADPALKDLHNNTIDTAPVPTTNQRL